MACTKQNLLPAKALNNLAQTGKCAGGEEYFLGVRDVTETFHQTASIFYVIARRALARRSNLIAVLGIASGEEQEHPRNDRHLRTIYE
jgi:hypothetical protein